MSSEDADMVKMLSTVGISFSGKSTSFTRTNCTPTESPSWELDG